MGKLLNTTYQETVDTMTGFYKDLVNHPFYHFNDKKPITVTYYNINKTFSSLDAGSKLQYDNIGNDSPIRYNRIFDFLLYGVEKINLNSEMGDFGLEDDKIETDGYVLPNTIVPTEGDYFEINHIERSKFLFQVTDVQKDTLDNGSNVYKIHAKLEYLDNEDIINRIVHNYKMIFSREGTNMATVIRCEDYDIAKEMDRYAVMLKKYFNDIFYNTSVQTYIYEDLTPVKIYDQYMIEFLIRNEIMDNGEDYVYVNHQIPTQKTFAIDYDKTIFRYFEEKNKDIIKSRYIIGAVPITAYGTIFYSRYDDYFKAVYKDTPAKYFSYCLNEELLYRIMDHNLVEDIRDPNGNTPIWKNIIIKYFYDEEVTIDELEAIKEIDFKYAKEAFYLMPILIFCLEKYIVNIINSQHMDNYDLYNH